MRPPVCSEVLAHGQSGLVCSLLLGGTSPCLGLDAIKTDSCRLTKATAKGTGGQMSIARKVPMLWCNPISEVAASVVRG